MGWLKSVIRGLARRSETTPVAEVGRKFEEPIRMTGPGLPPCWVGPRYILSVQHYRGRNRKERRAFETLRAAMKRRSLTVHEAKQFRLLDSYGSVT